MRRRRLLAVALGGVVLLALGSAAGALPVRLSVQPRSPHALDPARVDLLSPSVLRLRVLAVSPSGHALRVRMRTIGQGHASGSFRFPIPGIWRLSAMDRTSGRQVGTPLRVTVRTAVPTVAPAGFGPVGEPGCTPPSPADASQEGLRDVFGTAIGGEQFWALPFVPDGASWARTDAAVFDGLVGKEIKIVFGMTSFHSPFRAFGPDGAVLAPVWGPSFHSGSNWDRQPGVEWGAGFVFSSAGCWRIAVGSRGALYVLIRS